MLDDTPIRTVFGEPITWALLVRRFRHSKNRWLAARQLMRHLVRAVLARGLGISRPFRGVGREIWVQVVMAVNYPLGWLRSPHQIVERWEAPDRPLSEKVVLFVHFDANGRVIPATREFLQSLCAAGLSVVFVTNSEHILDEDKAFLRNHCSAILIRHNIGYDFGAWRDALDTLQLPRPQTRAIYMVNDSVYGPFGDLGSVLAGVDFKRADLWGLTESWQHQYHLQSFFLACGEGAIRSRAWRRFWRSVRPVPCKDWIIRHCEIGFTSALSRGGIRPAALFPQSALLDEAEIERLEAVLKDGQAQHGANERLQAQATHAHRILRSARLGKQDLNPSIDLWRQLLCAGYPFVKRELLLANPSKVTDVFDWESVVSHRLHADPQPLAAQIRLSLGDRLPVVWNSPTDEPYYAKVEQD
ncbi:rhamnan synthesis F family protein [Acidisoma cladoniae]|uniref:rhamnan synthesis F family protein n=1 Tax=Acidisoma cladoniae TaxID=3040935 RepID=UPI00254ADFF7|nr:rhamnan synthesis F family protein [Acidisoma sp. PAMC 29798]